MTEPRANDPHRTLPGLPHRTESGSMEPRSLDKLPMKPPASDPPTPDPHHTLPRLPQRTGSGSMEARSPDERR